MLEVFRVLVKNFWLLVWVVVRWVGVLVLLLLKNSIGSLCLRLVWVLLVSCRFMLGLVKLIFMMIVVG